jgi:RHS repeat-associated protein
VGKSKLMIAWGTLSLAAIANNAHAQGVTRLYDGANRLVRETVGGQVVSYKYDGLGNLAVRCLGAACTDIIVSPDRRVLGEEGDVTRVYADGPSGPVANRSGAAAPQYPLVDSLGSVLGQASPTGTLAARRAFSAYGDVRATTDTSSVGYTGEFQDSTSKSVWLRARSYSPESGRFVERDTFEGHPERASSLNRYSYVENGPLVATDPTGHDKIIRGITISVYAGLGGGLEFLEGDGDYNYFCLAFGVGMDTSVGVPLGQSTPPTALALRASTGVNTPGYIKGIFGFGVAATGVVDLTGGEVNTGIIAGAPATSIPIVTASNNLYTPRDTQVTPFWSKADNPSELVSKVQTDRFVGGALDPFDPLKGLLQPGYNKDRQLRGKSLVPARPVGADGKVAPGRPVGADRKVAGGSLWGNINLRGCYMIPKQKDGPPPSNLEALQGRDLCKTNLERRKKWGP